MIYTYDGVYMFLKYNKRQDSIPATSNNLNSGMDDQQYYQCSKLCFIASTSTHLPSLKLREHLKQWGWKMSFLLEKASYQVLCLFAECIYPIWLHQICPKFSLQTSLNFFLAKTSSSMFLLVSNDCILNQLSKQHGYWKWMGQIVQMSNKNSIHNFRCVFLKSPKNITKCWCMECEFKWAVMNSPSFQRSPRFSSRAPFWRIPHSPLPPRHAGP